MYLKERLQVIMDNRVKETIKKKTVTINDPFFGEINEINLHEKDIVRLESNRDRLNRIAQHNGIFDSIQIRGLPYGEPR